MLTCWGDEEDAALEGLTPEAQVMYLRVLRRHMDSASGVVGISRRISEADLAAVLRVRPDWGSNQRPAPPTRAYLRARLEELKRAGLAVPVPGPPGAKGLFFSLPWATTHPSVQKRNNRGTTNGTTQEQPRVEPNNQELTGDPGSRNNRLKYEGTTMYLASNKDYKNKNPNVRLATPPAPWDAAVPHDGEVDSQEIPTPPPTPPASPPLTPAAEAKRAEAARLRAEAREVLDFLNERTGRHYRYSDTALAPILRSLKSGITALQCRQIIVRKCREWGNNPEMALYLRPATLFGAQKVEQYLGELGSPPVIPARPTLTAVAR